MLSPALAFATPRKLPKIKDLAGRVVVLDIAFAGLGGKSGFDHVTRPFIDALGDRLALWVDHHDHAAHAEFASDDRFVLSTKAEHGACPEMIDEALVRRAGRVDTIVCHTDFDGLVSAAKWIRGGVEPYPGADEDARAIDTRQGKPGPTAVRIDRALRARPRDQGLFGLVVRHLATGLSDTSLWAPIDEAAKELLPVERESRRAARDYRVVPPGVAIVDVTSGYDKIDKTLLLLLGQERAKVSVVLDRDNVAVAAGFDSGMNFIELLGLSGGMPTRVSLPRGRTADVLAALGVERDVIDLYT